MNGATFQLLRLTSKLIGEVITSIANSDTKPYINRYKNQQTPEQVAADKAAQAAIDKVIARQRNEEYAIKREKNKRIGYAILLCIFVVVGLISYNYGFIAMIIASWFLIIPIVVAMVYLW